MVVFVHNTLNDSDNRSSLDVAIVDRRLPARFTSLRPWAWDDFTSATTATIRTVSWQGGYCIRKGPLLPPSGGPPRPISTTFGLWFVRDSNGRPAPFNYIDEFGVTSSEAHEHFTFDSVRPDADCAYYDYTAVVPMPFPVEATPVTGC